MKAVVAHTQDPNDLDRLDLREAYDRGRRDERASRKRHPVLMTLMFLAAAVGLALIVLAAVNGSFGGAGQVMDQNLTTAADKAEPIVRDAAGDANRAVQNATSSSDRTDPPAAPN
jgi:hypothetical protein